MSSSITAYSIDITSTSSNREFLGFDWLVLDFDIYRCLTRHAEEKIYLHTAIRWEVIFPDSIDTTESLTAVKLNLGSWHVPTQTYSWTTAFVLHRLTFLVGVTSNASSNTDH